MKQEGDLIRRRRHVGIGEDDEIAGGREHAGTHGSALAAVWYAADLQSYAVDGARSLGTCLDEVGGAVGAAVVDDEDLDVRRQGRLTRRPLRFDRLLPEVVEQLVESRADPFRFVIGGKHQGEGHLARPSQQPARHEDTTAHPCMTEDYRAVLPRYRMVRHTSNGTMKA